MTHEMVKSFFNSSVQYVVASIPQYANNPLKDFIRSRKLPLDLPITSLVSQGSSCTKNEQGAIVPITTWRMSFLFWTKDIHSKGLAANFDYPNDEVFDVTVKVTLVRSHSRKLPPIEGYRHFIDKATSFDYIEYGPLDVFELSFRVVRFPLSESTYECIVTNLPADEYPPERIKAYYFARWGIESSFRKLKYTIGLSNFHAYKPESIKQEIWAKLTAYNVTETLVSQTVIEKNNGNTLIK